MSHQHAHQQRFSDWLLFDPPFGEVEFRHIAADVLSVSVVTRKNESTLPSEERIRFINALREMMHRGSYQNIAVIHANMHHNMHGAMGRLGLNRFLSWHRRFLLAFEQELRKVDAELTGSDVSDLGIPYWRWSENSNFPSWLLDVFPAFGSGGIGSNIEPREIGANGALPNINQVDEILTNFADSFDRSRRRFDGANEYEKFTFCLEGWADDLPAHNHVHVWVGGVMNNTSYSPADPIFWLHHCEIDRLWWIWQQAHTNSHPSVSRDQLQLTPWTESNYYSLLDIASIGYAFESTIP
ncbi:tyrosinase family protein [Methylomonas rivi]|uniref:Tyrosinase family protein n=1 Tax=Methylomonas rivi TaxID=2952226 RepID=A0ABT1U935_9GAMM|nr:tyrosinase family protein [Methylomonas sp. WSC-6]MCQ8130366.1 tyrosinase family protein [Methylomonas sp. WSC-6]